MINPLQQAPTYIMIDGLAECPTTTGLPFPCNKILVLVKDLVGLSILGL